jgi:hypothetical protein
MKGEVVVKRMQFHAKAGLLAETQWPESAMGQHDIGCLSGEHVSSGSAVPDTDPRLLIAFGWSLLNHLRTLRM